MKKHEPTYLYLVSGILFAFAFAIFLIDCVGKYPGEYGEIIEENFAIAYEPGLLRGAICN